MGNYFFLENYFTSEGAVSHNVLYYQQLSITRYQVRFYAYNNLEYPAFKESWKLAILIVHLSRSSSPHPSPSLKPQDDGYN